jgi:hypothetical protein
MADALRDQAIQEQRAADNPLLSEAANWIRGRSYTRALVELVARIMVIEEELKKWRLLR